jgi:hypothetical protein
LPVKVWQCGLCGWVRLGFFSRWLVRIFGARRWCPVNIGPITDVICIDDWNVDLIVKLGSLIVDLIPDPEVECRPGLLTGAEQAN